VRTHPNAEQVGAIVVVEDDDSSRQAYQRVLSAAGFRTKAFASAENLLESGAALSAACLVLDIHLPGLSGFELRRNLACACGAPLPVIFMTGHDEVAAREQAASLGATAYLAKPFAGRTLVEAVSRAVGVAHEAGI
jgi:FixJ family two-component response regulator